MLRTILLGLLFLPASLGLLSQAIGASDLSQQLLAFAFFLFCLEQGYMAMSDLQQVAEVREQVQDDRVSRFYWVTVTTIGMELAGFYAAWVWLGPGAIGVLLSQIWFNTLAGVQLHPGQSDPIRTYGVIDRLPVLIADGVGLLCVSLWLARVAPIAMAGGLFGMVLLYGVIKYFVPLKKRFGFS